MPGEVFRSTVPKTDPPFPVYDVNPHWQVFHHMPEQLRVIEEVRRHDLAAPPSGFIGSQGGELQGQPCSEVPFPATPLYIGAVGAALQGTSVRVLANGEFGVQEWNGANS